MYTYMSLCVSSKRVFVLVKSKISLFVNIIPSLTLQVLEDIENSMAACMIVTYRFNRFMASISDLYTEACGAVGHKRHIPLKNQMNPSKNALNEFRNSVFLPWWKRGADAKTSYNKLSAPLTPLVCYATGAEIFVGWKKILLLMKKILDTPQLIYQNWGYMYRLLTI